MKTTALLLLTLALEAQPIQDVFSGGEAGYKSYRIPALLATREGTLLAFAEGRKNNARDDGDIDIVLRRSTDQGRNWSPLQVVHEEGKDAPVTIGNPSPVQDRKTGRIHLLFTRNNQRSLHTWSGDDGKSWSQPVEISEAVRGVPFAWTRIGAGPGHAIQLRSGRLLAPLWLNDKIRTNYRSGAIYSDDNGRTWKAGGIVTPPDGKANECMLYERADRAVVMNLRSSQKVRHAAVSRDGGATWSEAVAVPALVDPVCQASVLALQQRAHPGRVVFLNPASERRRDLTMRLSDDGGNTWPHSRLISGTPAGYSDLAPGRGQTILCLFEYGARNYNERIGFRSVPVRWLVDAPE
ncbi:MAG: exo-alpha-sialidase [Acidobacteria bacterium]|nr:exo-alpha-sialidase [Acidobacteriota bacterium]